MPKASPSKLPTEFWHARHSCGHAVYWSDPAVVMRAAPWPCPWCGAADGKRVPQNVPMLHDPNNGVLAFRELLPDQRVPWPSELANGPER